jgi:hypothetical protein
MPDFDAETKKRLRLKRHAEGVERKIAEEGRASIATEIPKGKAYAKEYESKYGGPD